jgi:hypothetical protein
MVSLFYQSWMQTKKQSYILFGVVLLISGLGGFVLQNNDISFCYGFFIGICIVVAIKTFQFHDNRDRQHYLLIPASTGEKLIISIVETQFIQPLLLLFAMILGLFLGISIRKLTGWRVPDINTFSVLSACLRDTIGNLSFVLGLLLTQAIFIFGNLYFKSRGWLKTILSFIVLMLFIGIIDGIIINSTIIHSGVTTIEFNDFNVYASENRCMSALVSGVVILVFWVMSYFRLRETEV